MKILYALSEKNVPTCFIAIFTYFNGRDNKFSISRTIFDIYLVLYKIFDNTHLMHLAILLKR